MHRITKLALAAVGLTAVPAAVLVATNGSNAPAAATPEAPAITTVAQSNNARTFNIDAVHSSAHFSIVHLGVTNFIGRFNTISGSYRLDFDNPDNSMIDITIDVNSVDTNNGARDRHLKGPDFFNAPQYPNATFKGTAFEATGDDTMRVTGDLTIRGTTRSISFDLQHTGEGDRGGNFGYRAGFYAEPVIQRQAFGVSYMPDGLSNDVKLMISIQGIGQ